MGNSTKSRRADKPAKPHKGFPLFAHANGQWTKKVRGKLFNFGPWADPNAALHLWLDEKDDRLAGRTPRSKSLDGLTVNALCDRFLTLGTNRVETGELSPRTLTDYVSTCRFMADEFGKDRLVDDLRPDDFAELRRAFGRRHGVVRLVKDVSIVRMVFKFGAKQELITKVVDFGAEFDPPSKRNLRKAKHANGEKTSLLTRLAVCSVRRTGNCGQCVCWVPTVNLKVGCWVWFSSIVLFLLGSMFFDIASRRICRSGA